MSEKRRRPAGIWGKTLRRLRASKGAMVGLVFVTLLAAAAYFAPLLANNKPLAIRYGGELSFTAFRDLFPFHLFLEKDAVSLRLQQNPDWLLDLETLPDPKVDTCILPPIPYSPFQARLYDVNAPPSLGSRHLFGCDDRGRDAASRMLHGAKVSLLVGFLAMGVAAFVGVLLGGLGGYLGGWVDSAVVSRLIEVMMCFPAFFLILTVVAVMDPKYLNIWTIMVIIGLTGWPGMARYTRAEFIRLKEADFAVAAKALGANRLRIAARHILPNAMAPLLVNVSFGVAGAILLEASISFLGVGVQPPDPSWGNILQQVTLHWDSWWLGVFPGTAIFLSVLSYNLIGEGLRDALDPRLLR